MKQWNRLRVEPFVCVSLTRDVYNNTILRGMNSQTIHRGHLKVLYYAEFTLPVFSNSNMHL